jgi:hypothetical protein
MLRSVDWVVSDVSGSLPVPSSSAESNMLCRNVYNYQSAPCNTPEGRISQILPSSGMLHSVGWLSTDVSRLLIGPVYKGSAHEESRGAKGRCFIGKSVHGGNCPEGAELAISVVGRGGLWTRDMGPVSRLLQKTTPAARSTTGGTIGKE